MDSYFKIFKLIRKHELHVTKRNIAIHTFNYVYFTKEAPANEGFCQCGIYFCNFRLYLGVNFRVLESGYVAFSEFEG